MSPALNKCVSLGGWTNVLPDRVNNYRTSLPGAGVPQTVPNEAGPVDPNTHKFSEEVPWTMVQEFSDLGVTHVKFWVNWKELAEAIDGTPSDRHPYALGRVPQTFEEQALFMDTTKGDTPYIDDKPLIHYLDESIREANVNGLKVILGVYQSAPSWSAAHLKGTPSERSYYQHFPDDLTADSPYGWFIRYLIARYTGDETGGPGCGCIPAIGNPSAARINFIEPLNEPNYEWWPQVVSDGQSYINQSTCKASQAISTCEWWCRFHALDYDPLFNPTVIDGHWDNVVTVLGPSGADKTQIQYDNLSGEQLSTPWDEFSSGVLNLLAGGSHFLMRVGWAHHNYSDIEEERPFVGAGGQLKEPRVYALADMLEQYGFLDNNPYYPDQWRREIWLTEGTYRMGQGRADDGDAEPYGQLPDLNDALPIEDQPRGERQIRQRRAISNNFNLMRDTTRANAVLWTQHAMCEELSTSADQYGLRENMRRGTVNGPGRRRLSWFAFRDLVP